MLRGKHRFGVFENMVLRKVFALKKEEVAHEGTKLHNEELQYPQSPVNIIWMIKSWRKRWEGRVVCIGVRVTFSLQTP
jgi:hypothetical protein